MECERSALERQAADALRRARRLPIGPYRNDLRQLAVGLLWLHRNGMVKPVNDRADDHPHHDPPVDHQNSTTSLGLGYTSERKGPGTNRPHRA
jgi:hypothetical protein